MEWIDIKNKKPEWGELILVYRGKHNHPDRWKFDLPPLIDVTETFDSSITHWLPIPDLPLEGK